MKIINLLKLNYQNYTTDILLENQFESCYVSDLLSNVLKQGKEDFGLITTLVNMNVIAVASLLSLPFVLFCEGKTPTQEMIEKANIEGIALLSSNGTAMEAILAMNRIGAL